MKDPPGPWMLKVPLNLRMGANERRNGFQLASKPGENHERRLSHLEFCFRSKGFYTGRRHYKT